VHHRVIGGFGGALLRSLVTFIVYRLGGQQYVKSHAVAKNNNGQQHKEVSQRGHVLVDDRDREKQRFEPLEPASVTRHATALNLVADVETMPRVGFTTA
jgi:hypothetical protein